MADEVFALTERRKGQLAELLDTARPRTVSTAKGIGMPAAVVRCGAADADHSGYFLGTLVWHDGAAWQTGSEGVVRLRHLRGLSLTAGVYYHAVGDGRLDDGTPVFWTGEEAPSDVPHPLTDWCLLGAPTNVLGMQRLMFDPVTGVATCETRGFCGCPPGEPPAPACCDLWYCTTDAGWVHFTMGVDGTYYDADTNPAPPANWDGSPPHLTEEDAEAACPTPVPTVVTACGTVSTTLKVTRGAQVFTISYDSGTDQWTGYYGATFDCTNGFSVTLACVSGAWYVGTVASFGGPASVVVTPSSTSPFLLMYSGAADGVYCTGTVNFTVSEV